ncbi:hypothetical protein FK529_09195 [Tsukamurella asaccharolytica]|uniref:Uncharacterized protein n=1 Tax=Tsukamurella asaccharolytica TaxID=2592067 RepID=A0A5C5R998_9ACTN|nr:hypothetical protein FK529_09195 [Tsukamurella asaccharolytica]
MLSTAVPPHLRDSKTKAAFWILAPVVTVVVFGGAALAASGKPSTVSTLIYVLAAVIYVAYLVAGAYLVRRKRPKC